MFIKSSHLSFALVFIAVFTASSLAQPAVVSSKTSVESGAGESNGATLTAMTDLSDKCVLIAGRSAFKNNFFVASCEGTLDVGETRSLGYVRDISFFDAADGAVAGFLIVNGTIAKISGDPVSRIKGSRFAPVDTGEIPNRGFERVKAFGTGSVIAIGGEGKIVISHDSGNYWTKVNSGTTLDLVDVTFADAVRGWAVGIELSNGTRSNVAVV